MYNIVPLMKADEILENAMHKASDIKKVNIPSVKKGENPKIVRRQALSVAKIQSISDYTSSKLMHIVKAFPNMDSIPEFYKDIIDSHISIDDIHIALSKVSKAAGVINALAREYSHKIRVSSDMEGPNQIRKAFYGRVSSIMKKLGPHIDLLIKVREIMRKMPTIDMDIPTIVVAGAPNVGKSSLVNILSTAKIEVATYPFTTKEVSVGIMEYKGIRFQIVDTPGLLDRDSTEQNPIERRASAAVRNIADILVFIIDLSMTCGKTLEEQVSVYKVVSGLMEDIPVIILGSKSDLLNNTADVAIPENMPGINLTISTHTGAGLDDLKELLFNTLTKDAQYRP